MKQWWNVWAGLCAVVLAVSAPSAQQPEAIRLIVKGDDMGAAQGINAATIQAHREGVLTTTNVIVPGPWLLDAARRVNETPGLDVGIHLALTSEWERVKWRPLTAAPSLVDENGYFFPMVRPREGFAPKTSLSEAAPDLGEIEKELRAQIETAKRLMPQVTYTWEHMGFGSLSPDVRALVKRLTAEYKLITPSDLKLQFLGRVYEGTDTGEEKARKLAAKLETIGPGTWLTVDHVALDTPETQAIGHLGYEYVAADRSAVLHAWTSPLVKDVIKRRGIALVSYRDLR